MAFRELEQIAACALDDSRASCDKLYVMDLETLVNDVADVLKQIDAAAEPFKGFQPGVGPYGEPQLLKLVAAKLGMLSGYEAGVQTKRTPDILISGQWALEVKLARPFGDNGDLRRIGL
ncbi:MAG TPA: hypothetical protein VKX49_11820 [Bryobacteraceae bacterium]|nr:hypothetical protein [Bryobacteraceae bacterium]